MKREPARETIGDRLFTLRQRNGLTQAEVAQKLGYSDAAISQFESNHHKPPLDAIERFAAFFEVPFSYIAQGDNPPRTTPRYQATTSAELRALAIFRKAPVEAHEGMLAVLRVTARYAGGLE